MSDHREKDQSKIDENNNTPKKNLFMRFLDFVEVTGNRMPHPVTLFAMFSVGIIILSGICAAMGVTITFETLNTSTKEITESTVSVRSLLSREGIAYLFSSMTPNFTSFAPLGTVLVAMLGVGLAEGTGLISATLRKLVLATPKSLITPVVVFAGIMSNIAADAGYVVLVPLGAVIFLSFGRHPLAGLAAAFAGVSGGFSANLVVNTLDPLLGGLTTEAARILDPSYEVLATANFYFMFVSTFLVTAIGTFVTDKIVEPRLGTYEGSAKVELTELSVSEKRGLRFALGSMLAFTVIILALALPENGVLRNPTTGSLSMGSPLISGLVPIIMFFFFIPAVFYGIGAKTLKSDKDVADMLAQSMAGMGGYIVLSFVAAQFIAYFNYTNLGTVFAVKGADALKAAGFTGLPLLVSFILVTGFINLFIGSSSAKWAIMAPVFVPMLMRLGISPEFTQVMYRIGDSTTNIISPLMAYFAIIVAFAQKYDKKSGIGTLISTMIPYSILFLIGWTLMLIVWYYLGLPIGPDAPIHLN